MKGSFTVLRLVRRLLDLSVSTQDDCWVEVRLML
jgi:hypothetical protein